MGFKVITAPTPPVITLAELQTHLKLTGVTLTTAEQNEITYMLEAVRMQAQHYTQASIGAQVLELALDAFPDSSGAIRLPMGATSLTSVKYIDTAGAEQTFNASYYTLDDYSNPNWVLLDSAQTDWPDTEDVANAVKVRYASGSNTLDPAVRNALLVGVGHLWAHRGDAGDATLPPAFHALLDTVKNYG